jgi:hypothetical protein
LLLIEAKSFCDGHEAFRSESAFGVDVHGHTFAAAFRNWQLARYTKSVANLCFTCPELAEDLSDAACFDTAT